MKTPPQHHSPTTALEQETKRFGMEVKHLVNVILNCIFSLTLKGTRLRAILSIGLLISVVALFGLLSLDDVVLWRHFQNIWAYLFDPFNASSFTTNPIQDFMKIMWEIYNRPIALYYLIIFILPFIVAWQIASLYLADIFELEQVKTAQRYILQVALWGGSGKIRIREGELDTESESSPIYLIGGPGSVIVELDSVALFERPDGRPHVVGPTVDGPVRLDGFERFRQAIDLRDHRTEAMSISSRSQDGIPVQTADVSFVFSVVRGNNQGSSLQHPYPFFSTNAIESLIYEQVARVTPGGPRPADVSRDWAGTMTRLIRGALGNFASQHTLTEYLASFGVPEVQSALRQTSTVIQAAQRILPPEGPLPSLPTEENPPAFIPRPDIKALLFGEFAQGFPGLASQRGVELHWVGIGSWKTPSQIIPGQHLEAWQLSMDNQTRQRDGAPDLHFQYIIHLIQDVPLTRFGECLKKQTGHPDTMVSLLNGYREQFLRILHIIHKKQEPINIGSINRIIRALEHINQLLGLSNDFPAHWVRSNSSETTDTNEATESTESSYQVLVQLVRGDQAIADRLIEHEKTLFPNASRQELIDRAIKRLLRDRR